MPAPKRKAAPAARDSPSPAPSDVSGQDDFDNDDQPQQAMPFFNITYTTHRVSPLHIGSEPLSVTRLQLLSRRLRDTLVGDVVRGVQVGLAGDDGSLGRAGALESVEWRWVNYNDLLGLSDNDEEEEQRQREGSLDLGTPHRKKSSAKSQRALCLELKYENAYFTASLLPSGDAAGLPNVLPWTTSGDDSDITSSIASKSFIHLPLLLLRMPAPLRAVVSDFLSTTFDCRIGLLHLGTRSLIRMWEQWLASSRTGRGGAKVTKDVVLTLGFHLQDPSTLIAQAADDVAASTTTTPPSTANNPPITLPPAQSAGLRSIDVIIPSQHITRFLRTGRRIDPSTDRIDPATGLPRKGAAAKRPLFSYTSKAQTKAQQESVTRLRRKVAGGKSEEGWEWRTASRPYNAEDNDEDDEEVASITEQPFTEALAAYLTEHLALDLFHPAVRITKIACAGFVAAESGRLKVFSPSSSSASRAAKRLIRDICSKAVTGSHDGDVLGRNGSKDRKGKGKAGEDTGTGGAFSQAAVRIAELAASAGS